MFPYRPKPLGFRSTPGTHNSFFFLMSRSPAIRHSPPSANTQLLLRALQHSATITGSEPLPTTYSNRASRAQRPSYAHLNAEKCSCLFKNMAPALLLNKAILRTTRNIRSSKPSLWICSSYFALPKKDQDLSLQYGKQMGSLHSVSIHENKSLSALCQCSSLYTYKELLQ